MNDEARVWLDYAEENLSSARVLLENELYNPCLQNVQQAVEKALKSLLVEKSGNIKKTHSILELKNLAIQTGIEIDIDEEDCDFLDSIYLPSKYPLQSVLPYFHPDEKICRDAIQIAEKIISSIKSALGPRG